MSKDSISKLSEGQLACLRLVLVRSSSKEIARDLGISSHTVDQRLRTAMRTLGVSSRFEAARMIAAQSDTAYQPLVYQEPHVVSSQSPVESRAAATSRDHQQSAHTDAVQEEQALFPNSATSLPLTTPQFLPTSGERNDLRIAHRLLAILLLAVAIALGFGALIAGYEALVRLTA